MSQTPDKLFVFINETIIKLQSYNLNAKPLQDIQASAFTTSSEWLGELGLAVREVQKQKIRDETITEALSKIMDEVYAAWPHI